MGVEERSQFNLGLTFTVRRLDGSIREVYERDEPVAYLWKRVTVRGEDGSVKSDSGDQLSHSYTINFVKMLEYFMRSGTGTHPDILAYDITNTQRVITQWVAGYAEGGNKTWEAWWANALEDDDGFGIVLGTDDTAETNNDHALGSKITQGNGSGQLEYSPMSYVAPRINGQYVDLVLIRSFYNNSGESITAYEFGLYTKQARAASPTWTTWCMIRDTDSLGKTVLHGDTMTVQYTLRVGAGFTMQWWECLVEWLMCVYHTAQGHTGLASITDVNGVEKNGVMHLQGYYAASQCNVTSFQMNAADNVDTYGIVVGSGENAETLTDYALQTKISHGTGMGQLDYNATTFVAAAEVDENVDLIMSRSFFNGGSSQVVVKEVAWYLKNVKRASYGYDDGELCYMCAIRDSLGVGVTINVGDSGTVQYTLRSNIGV